MTIYTKQNVENDEKKDKAMLDVQVTVDSAPKVPKPSVNQRASARIDRSVRRDRRRRLYIQLFLLLGCILALSLCLFGTLYLFKNKSDKTYRGWCGVRYQSHYGAQSQNSKTSGLTAGPTTADTPSYMDEEVEIDGDLETLKVPKFDDNDQARFLHDFNQEVTFIRDETDHVCYALPLDTEKIPKPNTFMELLYMFRNGDLTPDAEEIQENYRVLPSALDYHDVLFMYGEHFASLCEGLKTFELIKVTEGDDMLTTTTTAVYEIVGKRFAMFPGGRFIIQYRIAV